jgi:hypothetical protein
MILQKKEKILKLTRHHGGESIHFSILPFNDGTIIVMGLVLINEWGWKCCVLSRVMIFTKEICVLNSHLSPHEYTNW